MTTLNAAAKAALRDAGIPQAAWARHWFPCNAVPGDPSTEIGRPVWLGDACGCTDDRCIGYHHDEREDCGCLPVLLGQYLAERAQTGSRQAAARRQAAREMLTRPPAVTRVLLDALNDAAEGYRKRAGSRRLAGPDLAVHREHYRVQEQACRDLAEMIRQPPPSGLPVAALIADWFMKGGAR